MTLWYLDQYAYYASVIVVITVGSAIVAVYEMRQQEKKVRKMVGDTINVVLRRNGKDIEVDATEVANTQMWLRCDFNISDCTWRHIGSPSNHIRLAMRCAHYERECDRQWSNADGRECTSDQVITERCRWMWKPRSTIFWAQPPHTLCRNHNSADQKLQGTASLGT